MRCLFWVLLTGGRPLKAPGDDCGSVCCLHIERLKKNIILPAIRSEQFITSHEQEPGVEGIKVGIVGAIKPNPGLFYGCSRVKIQLREVDKSATRLKILCYGETSNLVNGRAFDGDVNEKKERGWTRSNSE